MGGEQRFDLSLPQIVGGALATMTAAVAASYLGVAGTVIGAAVMSVGSTVGGAVYTHYLKRTGTHLPFLSRQEAGDDPPKKIEDNGELATAALATVREAPVRPSGGSPVAPYGETLGGPYGRTLAGSYGGTLAEPYGDGDEPEDLVVVDIDPATMEIPVTGPATMEIPAADPATAVIPAAGPATAGIPAAASATAGPSGITVELPAAVPAAAAATAAAGTAVPPGSTAVLPAVSGLSGGGGPSGDRGRARIWVLAATAVITFAVGMGAILGFEKVTGQPVASTVKGERSSGTSLNPGPVVRREEAPPVRERTPRPSDSAPATAPQATPEPTGTGEPARTEEPGSGATSKPTTPVTPSQAPTTSPTQVEPSLEPTGNPTGSPAPAETDAPAQGDAQDGEDVRVGPAGE
ncbi:hypothetical protein AB0D67_23685 [Streptosporangium sp. NPDC048047]|uniref:hypothetical protein n=1 Tax=Streptosporangium sp. NPDC048047 TaxID=3155748 RepID=UPI00342A111C